LADLEIESYQSRIDVSNFVLDIYPRGVYYTFMKSHYEDVKEEAQKKLNIIKGQLNGLSKMVDDDEYCIDLLNQSLAIQNSLKSLDSVLFERHLNTHVMHQFKLGDPKAVEELTSLFKRISK
jgi:CsoR family transcriptional regulator, copper-sensing transcriptional repressor